MAMFATIGGVVYRSFDQGKSWDPTVLNPGGRVVGFSVPWHQTLVPDPLDSNKVFAQIGGLIYRSNDAGESWNALVGVQGIRTLAASAKFLYAAGDSSLFYSHDDGDTWREIGGQVSTVDAIFPVTGETGILYIEQQSGEGIEKGFYLSTDGGLKWKFMPPKYFQRLLAVAIDSGNPPRIYASSDGSQVRTADALDPEEWEDVNVSAQSIAIHPGNPQVLAVYSGRGVHASLDRGDTWISLNEAGFLRDGEISHPPFVSEGLPLTIASTTPWTICVGSNDGVWCHPGLGP